MPSFKSAVLDVLPELIELRHDLHRQPELAYEETRTSARILKELEKIGGLTVRTGLAQTGIVATLNADREGRCVALRADIDALPIQEVNTFEHKSRRNGRMHACGHDGHIACLLGAARVLAAHRDELPGKVKFIFQPAEEHAGGGKRMVDEGALGDPEVDAAFAMHGWPEARLGSIWVGTGPIFAGSSDFDIELVGRGAHAAFPHHGTDVIVAASFIITKLQVVASRFTDPVDPALVSICAVHAGDTYNILPDRCKMLGTARALRQDTHDETTEHIKRIVESTAADFGVIGRVNFAEPYPPLVNDPAVAALVRQVGGDMLGRENVEADPPITMGAEDFAFYAQAVPSTMWLLGLCPRDRDDYPKLHQPDFDFVDLATPIGVEMHCRIAQQFLADGLPRGAPGTA